MTNKKEDIGISSLNSSTKKEDIGIISSNSSTAIAVAQLKTLQEEIIQKIRNGEWTTNGPRNEPSYLFGNQEIRDFLEILENIRMDCIHLKRKANEYFPRMILMVKKIGRNEKFI